MLEKLRAWARELKTQLLTLWYCRADPRTPLAAKIVAALVVAYALSPIDLIPDFIPILGYLDDLILVPLGIYLAFKLIPANVVADARKRAEDRAAAARPAGSYVVAAIIIAIWVLVLLAVFATVARAAPNEIKVFTDELAPHGE